MMWGRRDFMSPKAGSNPAPTMALTSLTSGIDVISNIFAFQANFIGAEPISRTYCLVV